MKDLVLEWKRYLKEADLTSVAPASNAQTPPISSTPAVKSSENGDDLLKKQEAKKALLDLQSAIANIQTQAAKLQTALQEAKKRKRAKVTKKKKSGDRCTRIAKRKYDVWPSAYASGAVVKCRQGKIWKGISEDMSDEEIDHALLLEAILHLKESNNQKPIIYPNFQGIDYADNGVGVEKTLKVKDCIGNEPNKDYKYFTTDKKDYVKGIIDSVSKNGIDALPPVKAIKHPLLDDKYLVIDGNHRLGAYMLGNISEIKAEVLNDDAIQLATPDTKWKEGAIPETMSLKDAKDQNIDLKKYFNTKQLEVKKTDKLEEKWSEKYKRSIDCKNPKGFSQKAHCQGKKKK